jgi:hypothetical protein
VVETKFIAKFPAAMAQTSVGGCVVEVCVCKVICFYGSLVCVMPDVVFVVFILTKPVADQGLLCRHVYCYLFRTCSCMEITVRLVFKTNIGRRDYV